MNTELLGFADLLLTNAILIWLGLRMVKRLDDLDNKVDQHETRISVVENEVNHYG